MVMVIRHLLKLTKEGVFMDDTTFRIEIEKLLVDKEYWRKYDWMNNATAN